MGSRAPRWALILGLCVASTVILFFSVRPAWRPVAPYGGPRFAHAVNSQERLLAVLRDPSVDFVEADVMVSAPEDGAPPIAIISQPPLRQSNLILEGFLFATAHASTALGVKLDFKEPAACPLARPLLDRERGWGRPRPVWLNADILRGPGGAASPFDPDAFITEWRYAMPEATLSLGWTTNPSLWDCRYTPAMVTDMLTRCRGAPNVTLAVHAFYASLSTTEMARLMDAGHSLTLWGPADRRVHAYLASLPDSRRVVDVRAPDLWEHGWFLLARLLHSPL